MTWAWTWDWAWTWACSADRWAGTGEIASARRAGASGSKQDRERFPVRRASRRMAIKAPEGCAYSCS
ncbi:hypothetical protein [Streptosporangium sp. H16]|uniref:hypothetical protein n=1 Tax=Streptosporangium sp. H16 TaxID=3444184 RepID=UPI003F7AC161